MDQIKIGKFIAECRKNNNLTQMQLAEKLNITDRAVSKWENGKAMPDSGIMLDLCKELKISVNELLSGEMIEMKNYDENAEKNLIDMVKQKEEADKRLLRIEILMGWIGVLPLLISTALVSLIPIEETIASIIVGTSIIPLLIAAPFAIKIEQTAGYYECKKCHHKYVPKYVSVFGAMHFGRTRYMKCPKCNKRSWQKKVISKE